MRRWHALLGLSLWLSMILAAAFVMSEVAPVSAAKTVEIEVGDGPTTNFFRPDTVTVEVGDTVVWKHTGNRPHDVTADNKAFESPRRMAKGQTFTWVANTAGTYTYLCTIHSAQQKGTLIVRAAAAGGGAAPAAPGVPRSGGGGMAGTETADLVEFNPLTLISMAIIGIVMLATRRRQG